MIIDDYSNNMVIIDDYRDFKQITQLLVIVLKNFFGFWGLFFNCSSTVIDVSEPLFSFFKDKKTQRNTAKHNKNRLL